MIRGLYHKAGACALAMMCAAGVALQARAYIVPDEPGQTATWSDLGQRGNLTTRDPFVGTYWEGGDAPAITNATATNLVVDLTATATEAKRLAEKKAGETQRYYGPITLCHKHTDDTNGAIYLGGLTGGVWTTWSFYWSTRYYPFVLCDGSTYDGIIDFLDSDRNTSTQLYLYPGAGATSTVNRLCVSGGPGVKVSAGSHGIVRDLIGPGSIGVNENATVSKAKAGSACPLPSSTAGTVEFMCPPGPLTSLRIADGSVILHGHAANDPTAPAGVPVLRLDASCADSLTLTGTARCVTQWRDADGRAAYANALSDGVHVPRLADDADSGLEAVDFGGLLGVSDALRSETTWGPAALMQLRTQLSNVRGIHLVFRDHFAGKPMPQLVGYSLTEWQRDWLRQDKNQLFSTSGFCDAPAAYGHVLYNGQSAMASARPDTRRHLNVIASTLSDGHLGTVLYVGGATKQSGWQGGAVIAEAILYTNVLTEAERLATHRYLMKKWRPSVKLWDYERITLRKGAALDVAEGVVSVRELDLPAGTTSFTKRGSGTLELGAYPASLKTIVVEGGDVAFADSHEAEADPQPAAEATVHFDASAWAEDGETYEEDGKTWLRRLNAHVRTNRNGDVYTLETPMPCDKKICTNATIRLNASPTGLAMIDCGRDLAAYAEDKTTVTNGSTSLKFYRNGTLEQTSDDDKLHREGFLVYMKTHDGATALSSCGSDIVKMASNADKMFADNKYSANRLIAGYWTYDGAWIEPWNCVNTKDEVHVVAFRGTRPMCLNSFYNDRNYGPQGGGLIGEILYYDRALTPQERRDTELYLLRKWKNPAATHPRDATLPASLPKIVYADAHAEVVLHVDEGTSLSVGWLEAASLSKTGGGTLSAKLDAEQLGTVNVTGGKLVLSDDILANAAYRGDATDVSSMTYTVDANGVTNVTVWSGATANTSLNNVTPRKPQIVHADLNGVGKKMPLMDLGILANNSEADLIPKSASFTLPEVGPIQEFYIVFQDKRGDCATNVYPQLIGTTQEGDKVNPTCHYPFLRESKTPYVQGHAIADDAWANDALKNGYTGMDGAKVSLSTKITDTNLHVYAFQATVAITNKNFALARRTSYRIGGACVGECLLYSGTNTVARRTAIENYLRAKWLGNDVPAATHFWNLGAVALSDDGELSLSDGGTVSIASLSGSGNVSFGDKAGSVSGTTSLAFTFRGTDDYDAIAIDGTFAVAPSGTAAVTISLPEGTRGRTLKGEYTLLSAEAFTDSGNFGNWSFALNGTWPRTAYPQIKFMEGKGLVLDVRSAGFSVILR